ncbi:MAG TPA: hypothetical protein VIV09_04130 [Pseudolabrys sp.]
MNKHIIAEIALGFAIFICVIWIAVNQYHKAVDNAIAEQTAQILAKSQKDKDEALKARDIQYRTDLQALNDKYDHLQKMTPQQIVIKAPEYIPGLQGKPPITIVGPETQNVPVGSAIVPPEDIQPLATAILDGEKCKLDFGKCQGDLKDWQVKYDLKDQESAQWEKAAKGGSWLGRLGKNAMKIGIGVGIGYMLHR